ncbi:MAG TPA: hypothetical protein PKZ76_02120 [Xanthomonadaceae bacterium]|nr:hypothetical protein [Xanthomonadaceae bacterium]
MGVRQKLEVGDPRQSDYMASTRWREFLKPHALAVAWGPREGGPWWPFHCLTLFAALDYLRKDSVGPLKQDPLPVGRVRAPEWLNPRTLLFVDLRGLESVALGAALAVRGCDLVCTFNNWPHPKGVLDSQHTLAALLRYASWIAAERRRPDTPAPVAWLCDADRLGTRRGNPGDFDNRYYIEDSVLPGPNYLRERGITRIVYLGVTNRPVQPDLSEHLYQYRQQGFEVFGTRLSEAVEFSPLTDLDLTSTRFNSSGYLLASGGGFGATVPHPSSGG